MTLINSWSDAQIDLQTIKEVLREFRDERDWIQYHKPRQLAAAIAIEASELQEIFLWQNGEGMSEEQREEVCDEVADILIYLCNFANVTNIDLAAVVEKKIERNRQRFPPKGRTEEWG